MHSGIIKGVSGGGIDINPYIFCKWSFKLKFNINMITKMGKIEFLLQILTPKIGIFLKKNANLIGVLGKHLKNGHFHL